MVWMDTHAHLQDEQFREDLNEVISRAQLAGIVKILLPGSDLADSRSALDLVKKHPQQFVCAVGIHPHHASQADQSAFDELHQLITGHHGREIVAIGEVGLDYHYDFSPRSVQQAIFEQFLEMAFECDLPLVVHDREATADCLAILNRQAAKGRLRSVPGVFHCFSGSSETARILLDMGFYLGFDGPITFKNARKSHDVIKACPLDRLLVETDSPYLAPVPFRGKRNEPAQIRMIGERMAEIKGLGTEDLAMITTENACRLFGLNIES